MAKIIFSDFSKEYTVEPNKKILAVAVANEVPHKYACGAAKCGLCACKVSGEGELSEMPLAERSLLEELEFDLDGTVRLACKAKILKGEVSVSQNLLEDE